MTDCWHNTLERIKVTHTALDGGVWVWLAYRCRECGDTFQYPEPFGITREVVIELL